ncbi:MAG: hypothetical protein JW942_05835 [Opitutales bacterium]|nr:hypothetical protein [Opitutales bacterium]
MESYLKGRQKAQRFQVKVPPQKDSGLDALAPANEEPEQIVRAEPAQDAELPPDAPDVDLVMRKGVVRRIIIHMPDGNRLELDCVYPGDEEEE